MVTEAPAVVDTGGLKQGLKQRHMSLIAIGGAIGAGLFVGSGVVIHAAGPAAIVSFLLAGVLVVLVMRMLGEMVIAQPAVGAFYEYARDALGPWAGFTIGWLYWYFWVIVVGVEAVAGAAILKQWVNAPIWVFALGLMLLLTATNLTSARNYGEFEFWFSSIKVIAIIVFIIVGLLFILGLWPHHSLSFGNLTSHHGFTPHGLTPAISKAAPAVAFFVGVEIVTLAAAESKEPRRAVARATNSVVFRVLLFYVGSIFVVVTINPWNSLNVLKSPYVAVLQTIGLHNAATIMNAVILTAVLSALNSGLYTASRILFALTRHGDAPQGLTKLSRGGVPVRSILLGTVVGYIAVIMSVVSPTGVFTFLVDSYGAVALFVYLLIAISEVSFRKRLERVAPEQITFRMWGFPYLSYLTILGMVGVIVATGIEADTRKEFALSVLSLVVVLVAYQLRRRRGQRTAAAPSTPTVAAASVPGPRPPEDS